MTAVQDMELIEVWSEADPERHARFTFPVFNLTGARSSAVVYFEVDPGKHLGMHTDSAEEVVYIVHGRGHGVVAGERADLEPGSLIVIPATVPHDVVNTGTDTMRVIGFFASSTIVSVFDDPLAPIGRRVVGTPLPEEQAVVATR
jgi:quercetin dioxygenase-like cupin family protein